MNATYYVNPQIIGTEDIGDDDARCWVCTAGYKDQVATCTGYDINAACRKALNLVELRVKETDRARRLFRLFCFFGMHNWAISGVTTFGVSKHCIVCGKSHMELKGGAQ